MSFHMELTIQDVCAFVADRDDNPRRFKVLLPDARETTAVSGRATVYSEDQAKNGKEQLFTMPAHFPFLRFWEDDLNQWDLNGLKRLAQYHSLHDNNKGKLRGLLFLNGVDLAFEGLADKELESGQFRNVAAMSQIYSPEEVSVDSRLLGNELEALKDRVALRLTIDRGILETHRVSRFNEELVHWRFLNDDLKESDLRTPLATAIQLTAQAEEEIVIVRQNHSNGSLRKLRFRPAERGETVKMTLGNTPLPDLLNAPQEPGCHTTRDFQIYSRLFSSEPSKPFIPVRPQVRQDDGFKEVNLNEGGDVTTESQCCHCCGFPADSSV